MVPGSILLPGAKADEAPPEVKVVRAVSREITDYEVFTGRTEAAMRVDLRARVSGYLINVNFKEGTDVKKGDVLFEIDPRPYQAELDRMDARLNLSVTHLKKAEAEFKRFKALLASRTVSQEEYDRVASEREEAEAAVVVAKADREVAKLNLTFTKVTAPIDGRIGRRIVDPGNIVKADETILATIIALNPMNVIFDVDEKTFPRLRRDTGKDATTVQIALASDKDFPLKGKLAFVDNQVDAKTGTVRVTAGLPNEKGVLLPGQFIRVRMPIGEPHKVVLMPPSTPLWFQPTSESGCWVVNDKNVVVERILEIGPRQDDGWRVVTKGLKEGDRVIVTTPEKDLTGMTVKPVEIVPEKEKK
jgi:RND family efflux transporter MFP subunit